MNTKQHKWKKICKICYNKLLLAHQCETFSNFIFISILALKIFKAHRSLIQEPSFFRKVFHYGKLTNGGGWGANWKGHHSFTWWCFGSWARAVQSMKFQGVTPKIKLHFTVVANWNETAKKFASVYHQSLTLWKQTRDQ